MQFHLVHVQRNVDQLLRSLNTLDTIVAHADSLDDPFAVELLKHRKDGVDFFSLTGAVVVEEIDSFDSELFSALLDTVSDVFGDFFLTPRSGLFSFRQTPLRGRPTQRQARHKLPPRCHTGCSNHVSVASLESYLHCLRR